MAKITPPETFEEELEMDVAEWLQMKKIEEFKDAFKNAGIKVVPMISMLDVSKMEMGTAHKGVKETYDELPSISKDWFKKIIREFQAKYESVSGGSSATLEPKGGGKQPSEEDEKIKELMARKKVMDDLMAEAEGLREAVKAEVNEKSQEVSTEQQRKLTKLFNRVKKATDVEPLLTKPTREQVLLAIDQAERATQSQKKVHESGEDLSLEELLNNVNVFVPRVMKPKKHGLGLSSTSAGSAILELREGLAEKDIEKAFGKSVDPIKSKQSEKFSASLKDEVVDAVYKEGSQFVGAMHASMAGVSPEGFGGAASLALSTVSSRVAEHEKHTHSTDESEDVCILKVFNHPEAMVKVEDVETRFVAQYRQDTLDLLARVVKIYADWTPGESGDKTRTLFFKENVDKLFKKDLDIWEDANKLLKKGTHVLPWQNLGGLMIYSFVTSKKHHKEDNQVTEAISSFGETTGSESVTAFCLFGGAHEAASFKKQSTEETAEAERHREDRSKFGQSLDVQIVGGSEGCLDALQPDQPHLFSRSMAYNSNWANLGHPEMGNPPPPMPVWDLFDLHRLGLDGPNGCEKVHDALDLAITASISKSEAISRAQCVKESIKLLQGFLERVYVTSEKFIGDSSGKGLDAVLVEMHEKLWSNNLKVAKEAAKEKDLNENGLFLKGIEVIFEQSNKANGILEVNQDSNDLNADCGGCYAYLKEVLTKNSDEAATGFEFYRGKSIKNVSDGWSVDFAKKGDKRQIKAVTGQEGRPKLRKDDLLLWAGSQNGWEKHNYVALSGSLNEHRGGPFLYLVRKKSIATCTA